VFIELVAIDRANELREKKQELGSEAVVYPGIIANQLTRLARK
jgi:hypothetical protein